MDAPQIEQAVFELEEVRIFIRERAGVSLFPYNYQRQASGSTTIADWVASRLTQHLKGQDVVVVDGTGAIPNRRTKMSTLRASYER